MAESAEVKTVSKKALAPQNFGGSLRNILFYSFLNVEGGVSSTKHSSRAALHCGSCCFDFCTWTTGFSHSPNARALDSQTPIFQQRLVGFKWFQSTGRWRPQTTQNQKGTPGTLEP